MISNSLRIRRRNPRPAPSLDEYLRRRKVTRRLLIPGVLALVAATSWADHRGLFLYPGDELARFERRWFVVRDMLSADTLLVDASPPDESRPGIRGEAERFMRQGCVGRRVRLDLDSRRVRHASGELLAYVELADGLQLNEYLLAAGLCTVASDLAHDRAGLFELLEAQARHDGAGVWAARP